MPIAPEAKIAVRIWRYASGRWRKSQAALTAISGQWPQM